MLLAAGGINDSILVVVLASAVAYGTPLLYAALGELLAERSGVLNLGVEGMMLVGAVMGFWAVQRTDSLLLAILVAALAGGAMALIHAFLVVTLRANQIVSGLALTIFAGAAGLSSYLGNDLNVAGQPAKHSFGPFLPHSWQNAKVDRADPAGAFGARVRVVGVRRARRGLPRAHAARAQPARRRRVARGSGRDGHQRRRRIATSHTIVGGAFAGVGGATFTLSITPQWVDGITGGAGWIAIALVIFAFWRPTLCLVGAYFFGAFSGIPFTFQARGILSGVPPELFQSLPYVMTVVVLVLVSSAGARRRLGAPAALGTPYVREER